MTIWSTTTGIMDRVMYYTVPWMFAPGQPWPKGKTGTLDERVVLRLGSIDSASCELDEEANKIADVRLRKKRKEESWENYVSLIETELSASETQFLPSEGRRLRLIRLIALTQAQKFKITPFTQENNEVFKFSECMDRATRNGHRFSFLAGLGIGSVLLGGGVYVAYAPMDENSDPQKTTQTIVAIGVIAAVWGWITYWLGLSTTGTIPDAASRAANDKQDHTHQLLEVYDDLAEKLIDMCFQSKYPREFVRNLALKINLDFIKETLKREAGLSSVSLNHILGFFSDAVRFAQADEGEVKRLFRTQKMKRHLEQKELEASVAELKKSMTIECSDIRVTYGHELEEIKKRIDFPVQDSSPK